MSPYMELNVRNAYLKKKQKKTWLGIACKLIVYRLCTQLIGLPVLIGNHMMYGSTPTPAAQKLPTSGPATTGSHTSALRPCR